MNLSSPWGIILREEEVSPGIVLVGTALHGGLKLSLEHFNKLSDFTKKLALNHQGFFFFSQDESNNLALLELKLDTSNSNLAKINATYPHYFLTEEGAQWLQKVPQNIDQDSDIVQVTRLDTGFKVTTKDDKEFLVLNYIEGKSLSDQEALGNVTNFYNKEEKKINANQLSEKLQEKFQLTGNNSIVLRPSHTKYAYLLEVINPIDLNYLGEIDLCLFPEIIKVWNE